MRIKGIYWFQPHLLFIIYLFYYLFLNEIYFQINVWILCDTFYVRKGCEMLAWPSPFVNHVLNCGYPLPPTLALLCTGLWLSLFCTECVISLVSFGGIIVVWEFPCAGVTFVCSIGSGILDLPVVEIGFRSLFKVVADPILSVFDVDIVNCVGFGILDGWVLAAVLLESLSVVFFIFSFAIFKYLFILSFVFSCIVLSNATMLSFRAMIASFVSCL